MPEQIKLFGNYRMAKERDIRKAGLLDQKENSIFLGKFGNKFLYFSGQEFVMVYAPTRSGKGVSIVVPNLLQYAGSVVCLDIKYENYELTSGFRKKHGQKVYLFSPGSVDYKTHRYNPLHYLSKDANLRLNDIDKICNYLIPTPPNVDPMWSAEGRSLLKAVILLVIDTPDIPHSLGEVLRQLRTEKPSKDYYQEILNSRSQELDTECMRGLSEFINTPEKTAGGIKKTVTSALNAWSNPLVDAATEKNDFDITRLRKERMTIYIGVSQDDLDAFSKVFSLLIQQIISLNTKKDDLPARYDSKGKLITGNPDIKEQCLLLLDEFCSLGRMSALEKSVSFLAGYNLRLMPIFQSESQLIGTYGQHGADNYMENHAVRVCFKPTMKKHAKTLSEEVGYTTVKQKSITTQRDLSGKGTSSVSQAKRALMLPEEIMEMNDDEQIVLARSCPYPIFSNKVLYMEDENFSYRINDPVEIPTVSTIDYPVRGQKGLAIETIYDKVELPEKSDKPLSDEEIDQAVESLFDLIDDSNEELEISNIAAHSNVGNAVKQLYQSF
jgi:type IV secretion system protein VirD4